MVGSGCKESEFSLLMSCEVVPSQIILSLLILKRWALRCCRKVVLMGKKGLIELLLKVRKMLC